jgi:hypothetical protein
MTPKLAIWIAATGLCLGGTAVSVAAHHAFSAEFDANKPVEVTGTVTKVEWTNPHVWMHLDVKKSDGTVEAWSFEAGTPNVLFRRGLSKDSLTAGTQIKVDGYQSKDGTKRANGRDVTFPDGRKLFLGSEGTGAPYELARPGVDTVDKPK